MKRKDFIKSLLAGSLVASSALESKAFATHKPIAHLTKDHVATIKCDEVILHPRYIEVPSGDWTKYLPAGGTMRLSGITGVASNVLILAEDSREPVTMRIISGRTGKQGIVLTFQVQSVELKDFGKIDIATDWPEIAR